MVNSTLPPSFSLSPGNAARTASLTATVLPSGVLVTASDRLSLPLVREIEVAGAVVSVTFATSPMVVGRACLVRTTLGNGVVGMGGSPLAAGGADAAGTAAWPV